MAHAGSRQLEESLRPLVEAQGFELVEFRVVPRRGRTLLRLFLDPLSEEPGSAVTHGDCMRVSRELEDEIEARGLMETSYVLEVSSSGLERPLTMIRQFRRSVGRLVELRVQEPAGQTATLVGRLIGVDEDGERLRVETEAEGVRELALAAIAVARLVPEFRRAAPEKPRKSWA